MIVRPIRLIAATIIAIVIAGLVFLQSASSALTRKQPESAVQLLPINGLAREQLANRQFISEIAKADDIVPSAERAVDVAKRAFADEPLTPNAHTILAIAEEDVIKRRAVLDASLALNRRSLLLQGQMLEAEIAQKDYEGSLATLDRILRVHPSQGATFFPLLLQVLEREEALPELASILDGKGPWHENFLTFAARESNALPNLAKLRLQREAANPAIDRNLIRGLAKGGETGLSHQIYSAAISAKRPQAGAGTVDWASDFPPFDWKFENEAGFRAQPSLSGNALEIFVRSGKGGVVARRWLAAPSGDAILSFSHSLLPQNQLKDARVLVSCADAEEPFFDRSLTPGTNRFALGPLRSRCEFVELAFHIRVWTGKPTVQGTIEQLQLTAK